MRAGRQIAISRMLSERDVFVRIAPRREFQPGDHDELWFFSHGFEHGHTVSDFGSMQKREVEWQQTSLAPTCFHSFKDLLVVFRGKVWRVVNVWETHVRQDQESLASN